MVCAHDGRHRIRKRNSLQDFRSHQWVHLHPVELFRSQLAWLVDDLFGHGQFPDVMEQGRRAQGLNLVFRQS